MPLFADPITYGTFLSLHRISHQNRTSSSPDTFTFARFEKPFFIDLEFAIVQSLFTTSSTAYRKLKNSDKAPSIAHGDPIHLITWCTCFFRLGVFMEVAECFYHLFLKEMCLPFNFFVTDLMIYSPTYCRAPTSS